MRPVLLATVLLVASVPFAAGNAPPVPVAQVPAESVLGEPIAFISASYDVDGTIVHTSWEFSDDGRTMLGASVVKALQFPGLHTVVLRVRDDLGAISSAELQVLVHAPLMSGRATALRVAEIASFADTGDVSTSQQVDERAAEGEVRHGGIRVARMLSEVRTIADAQGPRAVSRADVGYVYIPVPIGYLLVTGIEAESIVGCSFPTIVNTKLSQVRLNDAPIVPPGEVPANTRVELPGVGTLILNAQETTEDGRLAVTALRLLSPAGVVEVAHAEAGVAHCPYGS